MVGVAYRNDLYKSQQTYEDLQPEREAVLLGKQREGVYLYITRHAMYVLVLRNIEARSCNHCCRRKAII
jgi:hypothetical protein